MKLNDYDYHLPEQLIANYPLAERSASRLLRVNPKTQQLSDGVFSDIVNYFSPGDLLVFNNTKVIPARIFGQKSTGGKIECLVERLIDEQTVLAHVRASKSPKPGTKLLFDQDLVIRVIDRVGDLFQLQFSEQHTSLEWLNKLGNMPLPPYIKRQAEREDATRYQTVYAEIDGAVAAPTAGLHFDDALFDALKKHRINSAFLTLHVGAGTFQPVRVDNILEHKMHAEFIEIDEALCEKIRATKQSGNKVIAVGTTSVRALESAASNTQIIKPYAGDTDIFIYPGFEFKIIDAMITNFHLPKSSLLMLVSAFVGREFMLQAYEHAIEQQYRFYSYGDAMLIGDF